ncbi:hypothetical protein ACSLVK_07610 [Photorhabdus tasmaniensis]|uniref:hypothetical protein n=1 Tax=Photorhabdus tasmaniensis TaxID=1004159 RepID=UPI0010D0B2EC|nr:hypothetical protein [Photorhabdus tasmaniensis]
MSSSQAKDAFFQKLETNTNARKEDEEAFKRDVLEFQEDTKALILEIKKCLMDRQ